MEEAVVAPFKPKEDKFAVFSVGDKTGIEDIGPVLIDLGYTIIATDHTYEAFVKAGIKEEHLVHMPVLTGHSESLGGSIKTVHWKFHLGLQIDRTPEALAAARREGIVPIDFLFAGPLPIPALMRQLRSEYPNDEITAAFALRFVDVGGLASLMSAATNFWHVTVASRHSSYPDIIAELKRYGTTSIDLRRRLAQEVWQQIDDYASWVAKMYHDVPVKRPIPTVLHG